MYQLLDPGFVGLIISTFNRDTATEACTVQVSRHACTRYGDAYRAAWAHASFVAGLLNTCRVRSRG